MVNANLVSVKLTELEDRLQRIRRHCPADSTALAADPDALDLVSFNLILAIQASVDIASHIISDEGFAPAPTLAESFVRLHEHEVISAETQAALRLAAGLRNILTHLYSTVDPVKVHEAASTGIVDLERFATEVASWTHERVSHQTTD